VPAQGSSYLGQAVFKRETSWPHFIEVCFQAFKAGAMDALFAVAHYSPLAFL